MSRSLKIGLFFVLFMSMWTIIGVAQAPLFREAGEKIVTAITKYVGKSGTKTLAEELAELGGKEGAEAIAERIAREAGDEGLSKALKLAAVHGPDALKVLNNANSPSKILRALDELPADDVASGIRRLSAGSQGKAVAVVVERYGSAALRAEIGHPGVATKIVSALGDDGIALSQKLGQNQLIEVAKHADDIAQLPANQRKGVLNLLYSDTERMIQFMGRFLEANPGKSLFTLSATTIVLANSEKVLGDSEIVFDENGVPHVVEKHGLLDRTVDKSVDAIVRPLVTWVAPVIAIGLAIWIGVIIWPRWVASKLKVNSKKKAK